MRFDDDWDYAERNAYWGYAGGPAQTLALPAPPRECLRAAACTLRLLRCCWLSRRWLRPRALLAVPLPRLSHPAAPFTPPHEHAAPDLRDLRLSTLHLEAPSWQPSCSTPS